MLFGWVVGVDLGLVLCCFDVGAGRLIGRLFKLGRGEGDGIF